MNHLMKIIVTTIILSLLSPITAARSEDSTGIAFLGKITTLDPHKVQSNLELDILLMVYEPLFRLDGDFKFKKTFASVQMSEDWMTLSVKIDRGTRFHNGKDLTSQDIKASIERVMEIHPGLARGLEAISQITAEDRASLRIEFKYPNSFSLYSLSRIGIISDQVIIGIQKEFAKSGSGSGPYMFEESFLGHNLLLSRNDNYQLKEMNSQPSKIHIFTNIKPRSAINVFESGRADFIYPATSAMISEIRRSVSYGRIPELDVKGMDDNILFYFPDRTVFRRYYPWIAKENQNIPMGLGGTYVGSRNELLRSGIDVINLRIGNEIDEIRLRADLQANSWNDDEKWHDLQLEIKRTQPTIDEILEYNSVVQAGIKKTCAKKCPDACNNKCDKVDNNNLCCSLASMPLPDFVRIE